LSEAELSEHLAAATPSERRVMLALRRMVLRAAPGAAEAVKFGSLCYYHPDADLGSIGGNICMIEVRDGAVALSFIHGARLEDPDGLLQGEGKAKRFVPVDGIQAAADPRLVALVRAAAAVRAWE
jgi:hypothetical protein